MAATQTNDDTRERIENLTHREMSAADYIAYRGFDPSLGEGYSVAASHDGVLVLREPDGSENYYVQVYGPRFRYDRDEPDAAYVSWPSFGAKPNAEVTRKYARLIEVAAHYAADLDRLANQIIKEDA